MAKTWAAKGRRAGRALTALLLTLPAQARAADGFTAMAKAFARAVEGRGVSRVAVLPFDPSDGSDPAEGWTISERLVTRLVRRGGVQAVERSLLHKLMQEHALGRTGLLDEASVRRLGGLLGVDAVVTGTFVTVGGEALVDARFIEFETGLILAADERKVARDWLTAARREARREAREAPGPAPAAGPFSVRRAAWAPDPAPAEVPAELSCADAAGRTRGIEAGVLDLKARYWASRLRQGLARDAAQASLGPGAVDAGLRRDFDARLEAYLAAPRLEPLSADEVRAFVEADGKAFGLRLRCGL